MPMASVWKAPAAIDRAASGSRARTGVVLSAKVPWPSSPLTPLPQQRTAPPHSRNAECIWPHAICRTGGGPPPPTPVSAARPRPARRRQRQAADLQPLELNVEELVVALIRRGSGGGGGGEAVESEGRGPAQTVSRLAGSASAAGRPQALAAPHPYTVPLAVSASECLSPAATASTWSPCGNAGSAARCGTAGSKRSTFCCWRAANAVTSKEVDGMTTGVENWETWPVPNWPDSLAPHVRTEPQRLPATATV